MGHASHRIIRKEQPCLVCGKIMKPGTGVFAWKKGYAHPRCAMDEIHRQSKK